MKNLFAKPRMSMLIHVLYLFSLMLICMNMPNRAIGQGHKYATWMPSSGVIPRGVLGAGAAGVADPRSAANNLDTEWARLRAEQVAIVVPVSGGGAYLQLKFDENLSPGTTTFIKISDLRTVGISLGVLGLLGLDGDGVTFDAYKDASNGSQSQNNGTIVAGGVVAHSLLDRGGQRFFAVTPNSSESYNSIRIKLNIPQDVDLLSLVRYDLDVYYAFTPNDITCGIATYADEGRATGLNLNLLNQPLVTNPNRAIDGNSNTYSRVSFGGLAVSVGSNVQQTFYYHGLTAPQDYFKVTFAIDGGALDLGLLGNYEVKAYNGNVEVFSTKIGAAVINKLDLLGLLQSGEPITLTFGPGVPFDRISVGINNLVSLSLASSPLKIYNVERYGMNGSPLSCLDPNPIPEPTPTDPMLSISNCSNTVLEFGHANFPYNAVDGKNDTYTTLEASSGLAAGLNAYYGFIELGFPLRTAGTTTYVRIDFDEDALLGLLDGSIGDLLNGVGNNVLFGDHYFTVQAKNNGTSVLTSSSNTGFFDETVKIIQDKNGHYYVAVTPNQAYNSLRITENLSALLGLGHVRNMKVYHACISTGAEDCEQAFATYSESTGLSLGLLGSGANGVVNAHLAIDENSASVEDDQTFSEIKLGGVGIELAASSFQFVDFHTLSDPRDYFKVKLGIDQGSALNLDLLKNIEIRAYNGDQLVYSQRLQNGLVAGLDILGLLQTNNEVTIPIGPGMAFDRVAVGISKLANLALFNNPLKLYSIKRFGADCPDPNPIIILPEVDSPFNQPGCASELGEFEHVNFPYNALDGYTNTYATLTSESGVLLGAGAQESELELKFAAPVTAGEYSYLHIGFEEDQLLGALVGGSLGGFVSDVADLVLFGKKYFDITVRDANGADIYTQSGINGFTTERARIVQDKIGRYYLAFTSDTDYQSIKVTLKYPGLVGLGASTSMHVYGLCRETLADDCEQAAFTSYDGTGLSLNLFEGANPAGVINPPYAIDDNTSNFTELSLGTAAIGATIHQDVFFKTKSDAKLKLRIRLPQTLVNVDLLGAYKVYLFDGDTQVREITLQNALVNGLDLLGLLNSGGVVGVEIDEQVQYDRVRFELGSVLGASIGNPVHLYGVYRISASCPDPTFEPSPFENCGVELVSASNTDDVQNLVDDNHNSYATLRSDAGLILGLGASDAHVELTYPAEVSAGITTYIRIDYDQNILADLLKGSLGGFATGLIDNLLLGDHYFNVEIKNGAGTEVLTRSSRNGFVNNANQPDHIVRLIQDNKGRYYLAITPTQDYKSIRITDHTNAIIGLTSQDKYLNVYGVCHGIPATPCAETFSTSQEGTGITLDVLNLGGAGVQNAFWTIDENYSNFSTISLGTAALGSYIQQNIQYNQTVTAGSSIKIRLAANGGDVNANIAQNIHLVAYKDGVIVETKEIEQALIGLNLVNLINNGTIGDFIYSPQVDIDEIALRLSSLVTVGITPAIRWYYAIPECSIAELVSWKSYEIDGDISLNSVKGGELVEYTIHVRNKGTKPLKNVVIRDELPDGVTYESGGVIDGNFVVFNVPQINVGQTVTSTFLVKVKANLTGVDVITNIAHVVSDEITTTQESYPPVDNLNPNEPDTDAPVGTNIPVDAIHDVDITLSGVSDGDNSARAGAGNIITYTITVKNIGNKDLTGIDLAALVPAETTIEDISGWDNDGNGNLSLQSPFDLVVNDNTVLTYKVRVDAGLDTDNVSSIDNTATVEYLAVDGTTDSKTENHSMPTICTEYDYDDVSITATANNICSGTSVTLEAIVTGLADELFIKWYSAYDATTGALSGLLHEGKDFNVTPLVTTTYYVVIQGPGICFDNPPASIVVNVIPTPERPTISVAGSTSICEGSVTTLSVSGTALSYQWYRNGNEIIGAKLATYDATESGIYTVRAFSGADVTGCSSELSASVTITVFEQSIAPEVTPFQQTVRLNSTPNMFSVSGVTVGTVKWYADPLLSIELATGLTYTPPTNTLGIFKYYVVIENGSCTSPITEVTLHVIEDPTSPDDCFVARDEVHGTSFPCILCGVLNPTNAIDANRNNFSRLVLPVGLLDGSVYQTLIFGHSGKAGDTVHVDVAIPVGLADVSVLGGVRFTLYNGNTEVASFDGDSPLLKIMILAGNQRGIFKIPAIAEFDRVEIRNKSGVATLLTSVDVYGAEIHQAIPELEFVDPVVICENDTRVIATIPATGTYLRWYDASNSMIHEGDSFTVPSNEAGNFIYYIEIVDEVSHCPSPNRIPVNVQINPAPVIQQQPQSQTVVAGRTATFTVAATNVTSYQWQVEDEQNNWVNINGAATASLGVDIDPSTNVGPYARYRVILSSGLGCTVTSEIALLTVVADYGFDDDAIAKTGTGNATAGEGYKYAVTVENKGPSMILDGTRIYFRDEVSLGQTINSVTYGTTTITPDANGLFSLAIEGDIAVGDKFAFEVSVFVDSDAPAQIKNTIHIWQNNPGTDVNNLPDPDGTAETPFIDVDRGYNLSITKVADDARVIAGGSTTFTVTVTNNGPSVIASGKDITLRERPGAGVEITNYEIISGTATIVGTDNTAIVTTNDEIAIGASIVVRISANILANAGAVITNGIDVWGPDKPIDPEDPDDDADTPEIPVDREYNLSITKVADDARVIAGGSTTFTVTITNNGPSAIASGKDITLRERPSAGVEITSYEIISGSGTIVGTDNSAVVTTNGELAVGGTIVVRISADILADAGTVITNGIDVWGPDKPIDPEDPDDDADTPDIPVDREYNLSITKIADQAQVVAGESTTFTVTITNNGPSILALGKDITLSERPGEGVIITGYEVVSENGTIASNGNAAVVTTTEDITVGSSIVVKITADISANAGDVITNGIDVWAPDKPIDPEDPDDDDDTPEIPVDHRLVTAVDDDAETPVGIAVTIDVLANDIENGWAIDPATVEIVDAPQNGTVDVLSTGDVVYTPNRNAQNVSSFTYRVKDVRGRYSNVATIRVGILPNPLILPNVITPNGDGYNDYLVIKGIEAYDRIELIVINRYGNEIYRHENYDNRWDGISIPDGTYFVLIRAFRGNDVTEIKNSLLIKRN